VPVLCTGGFVRIEPYECGIELCNLAQGNARRHVLVPGVAPCGSGEQRRILEAGDTGPAISKWHNEMKTPQYIKA
jgi:hypothetical protein